MALVIQIVLAVVVLLALVASFLSSKNWHWSQVLLALGLFLSAVGYAFLAADVVRIHRNLRQRIPENESKLADLEKRNEALLRGTDDVGLMNALFRSLEESPLDESDESMPGIRGLEHELHLITRERGRVWRGVMPAGQLAKSGKIAVTIPNPKPHGLAKDGIVFAFEAGNPNSANPTDSPQYLAEFRVESATGDGAVLRTVLRLNRRSGGRLSDSRGPWNLYETMPIDRHDLLAGLPEEALRRMLPPASVEEYLRHGTPATSDDDQWHRAGFDADGVRVGPEDEAVTFKYDRPLRDYAYLFGELAREQVVQIAKAKALQVDNKMLKRALAVAEEMREFREQRREQFSADLVGMRLDRDAIQTLLSLVEDQLAQVSAKLTETLARNSSLARQITAEQLSLMQAINAATPRPSGLPTPTP